MMVSFILWGLVCYGFIIYRSFAAVVLNFVLYGLHKGALEPVQRTLVAELSPAEYRATSLGGFRMIVGLCALPASLIAGMLWDRVGVLLPLEFSLVLTGLSLVILSLVKEG